MYKKRHVENLIKILETMYGTVLVTGARQVGKTTVLEQSTGYEKVSLDDSINRISAKESPATFLKNYPAPVIIDEVQKVPELFDQIKSEIDKDRTKKGLYYMTGSEQFKLMKGISESLSGRIGIARLFGLSLREFTDTDFSESFIPNAEYFDRRKFTARHMSDDELWHFIHRGCLPELVLNEAYRSDIYYSNYIETYIERDVRGDLGAGNELKFMKFLTACAAVCGEVLNLSSIASDVGISQPTASRWLSKLNETNIVYLLKPYSTNVIKRVIKSPKLYFTDTGLAAYLTKWSSAETLKNGAFAGHIFENFVIMEIVKSYYNVSTAEPELYFYRDSNGKEIDLIIEKDNTLYPLEIKMTADPLKKQIAAFDELNNIKGKQRGSGGIICRSDRLLLISEQDYIIPVEMV